MSAARPEDRELPVHHADPAPGRRRGGRDPVRRRRRARADPGRQRRHAASALTSCGTSSAARCSCTSSTARPQEPGRDPITDLDVIEAELTAYDELTGAGMASRPRIVVLNKIDVPEARDLAEIVLPDLQASGPARCTRSRPHRRGAAGTGVRAGRGRRAGQARRARGAADQARDQARAGRPGPTSSWCAIGGNAFRDQRRQAAPVDPADRLQQRRGRRLPGRPAGQARASKRPWPRPAPSPAPRC